MQIKDLTCIFAAALIAVSQPLMSRDDKEKKKEGWHGKGELGFVNTTGNTETTAGNMVLDFVYEKDKWRQRLGGSALFSKKDGQTDAERYTFGAQTDYKFSDRSYSFGALRYDGDKFAPYDPVTTLTVGYGRELIKNERHYLLGEIGAGYRSQKDALTGEEDSDAIARGRIDYRWTISPSTEFGNLLLLESGADNTFVQNDMGLSVAINARFAVKAGYQVRHNTELPPGTLEKTDTKFTTNLVYKF